MKKSIILSVIAGFVGLLSCMPDRNTNKPHISIYGSFLSGKYYVYEELEVNEKLGVIDVSARPMEIDYMNENPDEYDRTLYWSVVERKLTKTASEKESFVFDRILERESSLESEFIKYVQNLGRADDRMASAAFACAYIRGVPSITANNVLFGQPAGSDLSQWFLFKDMNIIGISGTDFKMTERAGINEEFLTPSDFFIEDTMMPLTLKIRLQQIPDEISRDNLHARLRGEDNVIIVTIKIPVTFEAYWAWLKAQYSNPNAEEKFYNGEIVAEFALNSK